MLAALTGIVPSCSGDMDKDIEAKSTLRLLRERSFTDLLASNEDYEASGVAILDDTLHVVFDNRTHIAEVDLSLTVATLGEGVRKRSDYEAITIATRPARRIYVAKEVGAGGRAAIVEVDTKGRLLSTEPTDLTVLDPTKGLEGIAWLDDIERMLALCEAGSCGDPTGSGHGVINVLRHEGGAWVTETALALPALAAFKDYSDLAVRSEAEGSYRLAVLSQESSALWLGTLTTRPLKIADTGAVYRFPRVAGRVQYCSPEGVTFIDAQTIAVVSDRAKNAAGCSKGEALHVFAIP